MTVSFVSALKDPRVAIARTASRDYPAATAGLEATRAIERISSLLGWTHPEFGPLGNVIPEDARVVVKPNLVMHRNEGDWGIDPLITHPSLIGAVVTAVLQSQASEVKVGDAPVQGCHFKELLKVTGLDLWSSELLGKEERFKGIDDFRRTTCDFVNGVRVASENLVDEDRFVLFDLGADSLLEPITDEEHPFRVTCYDPRLMKNTHAPRRHQYLVARDVIEADVIINLPKLKTHKKAGITCALKNLIGINGNKEYLPHHRTGGSETGGDCYPGGSRVKRALEYTLDRQNMTASYAAARLWHGVATNLDRLASLTGDHLGVEGSWSGNDTVWRTGLDLNRVLLYGRLDGSLASTPQRTVIHLVDAVIAGQGDGPLRPQPLPLGLVIGGRNAPSVDLVGAYLLGYDPLMVPIVREAFSQFSWPLTESKPDEVTVVGDLGSGNVAPLLTEMNLVQDIIYPAGWRDAVREENE